MVANNLNRILYKKMRVEYVLKSTDVGEIREINSLQKIKMTFCSLNIREDY